jgi:predicted DCC family thiol-disulfide oxidoreductase YuxK
VKSWTNGRITTKPWQTIPEEMTTLSLTDEDGMTQVWFVDANGRLSGGAEATNRALRHCWWLRSFTYLYFLPGIRQLQDWVYGWVAQNRYRLPGSTAQCALPPKKLGK